MRRRRAGGPLPQPNHCMTPTSLLDADGFHLTHFNAARPFSSFLPGMAGPYGKPMWVFYANRGQCVCSFGVNDRNGAMLEFHPANKAYALAPSHGFRTFLRRVGPGGPCLHEPFELRADDACVQRLSVRAEEIEIEELCTVLGVRIRVVYFTLPGKSLPVLVRAVTLDNTGAEPVHLQVLDGLPQIVPFGLEERLLKQMSRTMEAFAEVRQVEQRLPFFKLKVEPSDKPDIRWLEGGFFAFTLRGGDAVPIIVDPDLVFGPDTSLRTPRAFAMGEQIDALAARRQTLTACAFAQLTLRLEPGQSASWDSFFGQAPDWQQAEALRARAGGDARYTSGKRNENAALIRSLAARFDLNAGPPELAPYTRQAFLDNTLRGGQPVVIQGPGGPRVFHTFTRKHGDMERDYNAFELAASYWSQGNGNFRDVNQNRRCESYLYPEIDASTIETFFNLIQLDGYNPLVIEAETFELAPMHWPALFADWPAGDTAAWRDFLARPFSPGELQQRLNGAWGNSDIARPWFERIIGLSDKLQGASHGEGYWVDHWIYNLDLLDSYAAVFPDRLRAVLFERRDFSYFDNDHVVQPRERKHVLRADGSIRQLHAVVRDPEKTRLIAQRTERPHTMRTGHGTGALYRTTLMTKIVNLLAVKASLFDPSGIGLEMEADKPGWCDALNGLPGLFGSSTHEAHALRRWSAFTRRSLQESPGRDTALRMPREVATLVRAVTQHLALADLHDFSPSWQLLASCREKFRADTRLGIDGAEVDLGDTEILALLDAIDRVLAHGLGQAVDAQGLPQSYFTHAVTACEPLPADPLEDTPLRHVRALRFARKPVAAFLEGAVHALRNARDNDQAHAIYQAVRQSTLYDEKLGMYRVNAALDEESHEIGRSRIFSPGWLENESVFLHMHYKFLLETLRSGLAQEYFDDLRRGLVAFQQAAVYGRSPLENCSFIASSRFADAKLHGAGFVARLSGATAEWISMVLHMGLGPAPFRIVDGALRFEPRPVLADWMFTSVPTAERRAGSFGLLLFGSTWLVYDNPSRRGTFGDGAVAPAFFTLHYRDGTVHRHGGSHCPASLALDLRAGKMHTVTVELQ